MATSRATVEILALLRDGVSAPLRGIRSSLSTTFSGLRGIAAGGLGVAMAAAVKNMAEADTQLLRMSRTIRSSVEDISALKFGLDQLGIGSENLRELLNQIEGKRSDALRGGGGQARNAFAQLGIDIQELREVGAVDLLKRISDAYLVSGRSADAAAQLQAIFGDRFRELLPLLDQGSRGFERLREEAKRAGVLISDEDARNAEDFTKSWRNLRVEIEGLFRDVIQPALPFITDRLKEMRDVLRDMKDGIGQLFGGEQDKSADRLLELARENAKFLTGGQRGRKLNFQDEVARLIEEAGGQFERFDTGERMLVNDPQEFQQILANLDKMKVALGEVKEAANAAKKATPGFLDGFRSEVETTRKSLEDMFEFGKSIARETGDLLVDNADRVLKGLRDGAIEAKEAFRSLIDGIIADLTDLAQRELLKRVVNAGLSLLGGGPSEIKTSSLGGGGLLDGSGRPIGGGSGNKRLIGGRFGGPQAFGGGGTVINLSSNATAEQQRELVSTIMRHEASRNRQVRVAFRMP